MGFRIRDLHSNIKNTHTYKLLRHSGNYFFADVAIKAMGFVSIPIFTRFLTEEEYGIMSVFYANVPIFIVLLSLGTYSSVSRYCYENKDDFKEFLGTNLVLLGIIISITTSFFLIIRGKIYDLLNLPYPLPLLIVFVSILSIIYSIYLQTLYPQRQSKKVAITNISYSYTGLIIGIFLTLILHNNRYMGRIIGSIVTGLIFSVYFFYLLLPKINLSFRKKHIIYIFSYTLPLLVSSLSDQILGQFDRIMINSIIDSKAAGYYSIGYNIGMLTLLIIGAIQLSIGPDFFRYMKDRNLEKLDKLVDRMFSFVFIFGLGLILFGENILFFLSDPKFYAGALVIPPVVAGYIFYGLFAYYSSYISYIKKNIYLTITTLIAGLTNIILNIIYIPKFGFVAAAYTTLVSYFILFFSLWLIEKYLLKLKITPIIIFIKKLFLFYAMLGLFYFLISIPNFEVIPTILIKTIILILFISLILRKEIKIIIN